MSFARYAVYHLPGDPQLAAAGAEWLGWDIRAGAPAAQPAVAGLDAATATPRKYGFHATLKPPFRPKRGADQADLEAALQSFAETCAPARAEGLDLVALGRFLALVLRGDSTGFARVAADLVRGLDAFRAAPSEAELERRRKAGLTDRQERMLALWGYPYVMDEFRYHLTLTGRVPRSEIGFWRGAAALHLSRLPAPFVLDKVALVGERADGRFELIREMALSG